MYITICIVLQKKASRIEFPHYTMSNICRQFLIFSPSLILISPLSVCQTSNLFSMCLAHDCIAVFAVFFTQNHHSYRFKLSRQLVVGQNTKTFCNFHLTSTFFRLLSAEFSRFFIQHKWSFWFHNETPSAGLVKQIDVLAPY